MGRESGRDNIRVRGARQNNLKGFDLDLPVGRLIVVTGLSGSGKSSLAFDTLYAEGQRRYIETFSPYARQFFDRMDKPRVDAIEGIPPAIALEQRNSVRTTRSTVGTMTEICDHLKVLWPHLARLHCRQCGRPVVKESPRDIWDNLRGEREAGGDKGSGTVAPREPGEGGASKGSGEVLVTFCLPLSARLSLDEQLALVSKQGFRRLWIGSEVVRVEEAAVRLGKAPAELVVVQDRIVLKPGARSRFVEACEQAYHFGHGKLAVLFSERAAGGSGQERWGRPRRFSRHLHCATCDLEYREPSAALFSFNHPIGACPTCKGFGRIIAIDYDRAIPDRTRTLAQGAVRPWQTGMSAECQADLVRAAKKEGVPLDVPFRELCAEHQRWVIEGARDYGEGNEWPHAWYGVKGYFRWLESKAYKMHVRVLLSRYRAYRRCPACDGRRLQPDALLWRWSVNPSGRAREATSLTLAEFYALPIEEARRVVESLEAPAAKRKANDPLALALAEVRNRLGYLVEVGVGYLTLDRPTRTLSGGETQRVNLTTCLGTRLVNTLFVLDEPSVGLHPRDTERLVRVLSRLRDLGNTVVVVEHEAAVMRAADHLVDLGPGHGEGGGEVVAQGSYRDILGETRSLTGGYLAGRRSIELPVRRAVVPENERGDARRSVAGTELGEQTVPYRPALAGPAGAAARGGAAPGLVLRGVTRHNLRDLMVTIPLGRLVCLAGVSGSGKTTLAGELLNRLREHLGEAVSSGSLGAREAENETEETESDGEAGDGPGTATLSGAEHLEAVLLVDQSPIGRTPRSNPAVYTGAFEHLRELFAQTDAARQRGLGSSAFSFNSGQGQCEQCRGAGFEKIEMQFLSDVFIRCPACDGRRYRPHILEVRLPAPAGWSGRMGVVADPAGLSIADLLELPVDDALDFLGRCEGASAARAAGALRIVQEVGLGYLRLGQPINTLSGGESQRLKLAGHLVESAAVARGDVGTRGRTENGQGPAASAGTLFVFDEPTTGLHFEDVRVLLQVFQRLVDAGQSVLIIEHNVEVLKCADWIIDLGPEGGERGGRVLVAGTPEEVARCDGSHTGRALRGVLGSGRK